MVGDAGGAATGEGLNRLDLGQHETALAACSRVPKQWPDYPAALNNRGVTPEKLGQTEEAAASFPAAITAGPTGAEARGNPGDMATLTVGDTGIGFEPAYESKRHGLGLIQRLIQQVRGTVVVKSERGTVWNIQSPVHP